MLVSIGDLSDFSKISRPLTNLLQKDIPFVFDDDCLEGVIRAFDFNHFKS